MLRPSPTPRPSPAARPGGAAPALTLASLLADHAFLRLAWSNFGAVIPGRLYRANHPTPRRLARLVRRYGIRTVINLRGEAANASNPLSVATATALGVDHVFLAFESRGAPEASRILRFHEVYRTMRLPALVHCKAGADRAGFAAGLAVLFEGGTAAEALAQLSLRFLHFRDSRSGILDAFFRRYAAEAEGRISFLEWVAREYDAEALRRDFVPGGLASFVNDRLLRRE
ncbi:MAG: tyrosine-protein phosphatase [Rhodospirillales bacterium]|nr:tyrosine-protein phosphatase [Rhodospirillales bacterium]MDE2006537.1 tyrosine-protein phosphatase [Rhodospirillales bacterium]MDE2200216.1 tyrosine-protein phosphatase [Rhodospirillales bacterium]MDE2573901.1 tyrosine-protein phosphatase [Rhodospirillales bacterium]